MGKLFEQGNYTSWASEILTELGSDRATKLIAELQSQIDSRSNVGKSEVVNDGNTVVSYDMEDQMVFIKVHNGGRLVQSFSLPLETIPALTGLLHAKVGSVVLFDYGNRSCTAELDIDTVTIKMFRNGVEVDTYSLWDFEVQRIIIGLSHHLGNK